MNRMSGKIYHDPNIIGDTIQQQQTHCSRCSTCSYLSHALSRVSVFLAFEINATIMLMIHYRGFERASPRGLIAGQQADLSDLKVRTD